MSNWREARYTRFIVPVGGIIALACFFLPWMGIGTKNNLHLIRFGFVLSDPLIKIAFIASIALIGLSLLMITRRRPGIFKIPILICSGIGLSVLSAECLRYVNFGEISKEFDFASGFALHLGKFRFWGTTVGFVVAVIGMLVIRTGEKNEQSKTSIQENQTWPITITGGIIALISFFLPWEGIGAGIFWSGFGIAKWNPLITISLISCVSLVGVSIYALKQGTLWKYSVSILVSIGIGLGSIISHYIYYFNLFEFINKHGSEIEPNTLEYGLWGTVIGLIVSAIGMLLIKIQSYYKQKETTDNVNSIKVNV